jgi:hypothetical protein
MLELEFCHFKPDCDISVMQCLILNAILKIRVVDISNLGCYGGRYFIPRRNGPV